MPAPDRPTNISVIESCALFRPLTAEQKLTLAAGSHMVRAGRSEFIWLAGEPSECAAVVGVGFVKMTKAAASGQEVTMELLGPGQALGLIVAIEGRRFPLSAVAVTDCWYLKVPSRVLLPVYEASSEFKDQTLRSIGPRLRKAHDMMSRLSSGRVEERLAAVLFVVGESYGTPQGNGFRLDVPLTRQDIAEMAGTTVESTIRVLSRWQKEGLLTTERHIITVHDSEALERVL
jgi:CRP/FNR family transcriptional regulator